MPNAEKRGDAWRANWLEGTDRKSKTGFATKSAALRFAFDQEADYEEEQAQIADLPLAARLTWNEWRPDWERVRRAAASTALTDQSMINKHIVPKWGQRTLAEITRGEIDIWVSEMVEAGTTPGTIHKVFATFSGSLTKALQKGLIPANPCYRVPLPALPEGKERYFTREEVQAAISCLDPDYRSMAWALYKTGMRFGELAGMHWQRVDNVTNTFGIVEQYSSKTHAIAIYTKGRKIRDIPIPAELDLPTNPRRKSCGIAHDRHGADCRSGLVWTTPSGTPLDSHVLLRRKWYPALKKAGVDRGTLHALRHSYASQYMEDGGSVYDLQLLLGHDDVKTTYRYVHRRAAHLDRARLVERSQISNPSPTPEQKAS